jgi:CBS domain containing-hemolysin-like protein
MERDIDFICINNTTEQILETIRTTNHSRLPVKAANSDRIIGVLRTRAYLTEYRRDPSLKLRSVMKPPYFVRKDAKIDDLLSLMRQRKLQIAIVTDENKNTLGVVTLEDILEELVGEIFDEEDIVDKNFQTLGGNKYVINTHLLMSAAYEKMGLGDAPRNIATKPLISFMLETLGHLPVEDETFLHGNLEFTAKTLVDGRVTEAIVHILDEEALAARAAASGEEATV